MLVNNKRKSVDGLAAATAPNKRVAANLNSPTVESTKSHTVYIEWLRLEPGCFHGKLIKYYVVTKDHERILRVHSDAMQNKVWLTWNTVLDAELCAKHLSSPSGSPNGCECEYKVDHLQCVAADMLYLLQYELIKHAESAMDSSNSATINCTSTRPNSIVCCLWTQLMHLLLSPDVDDGEVFEIENAPDHIIDTVYYSARENPFHVLRTIRAYLQQFYKV